MQLKVTCQCGTKFSFDVEPVDGRMPFTVACPTCGVDGTEAANQLLAQTEATAPQAPYVPEVAAPQKSKLRVAGAHAAAPTSQPTAAAAAPTATGEMCNRHLDKPSAAHCTVCKKPICPECMS